MLKLDLRLGLKKDKCIHVTLDLVGLRILWISTLTDPRIDFPAI
jgi:hypothetical protein